MPKININDLIDFCDLFTIVNEPDHSRKKLLLYQQKYGIGSDVFYNIYTQALGLDFCNDDFVDWLYNYEIFLEAGGDIWEIKKEMFTNGEEVSTANQWDFNCILDRQASKEEKHERFSSLDKRIKSN